MDYQVPPHLIDALATWPGLVLSSLYLVPQLPQMHSPVRVSISDFEHAYLIDPVTALRSLSSSFMFQDEEELPVNVDEVSRREADSEEMKSELSFSRLSEIGGDNGEASWSKNTSKYRVFSLLKSIADFSDWDFPAFNEGDSTNLAGFPNQTSIRSFNLEDLQPCGPEEDHKRTFDSQHSISGDLDEGQAQVAMRVFLQGTASHDRLSPRQIILFKVPQKVLAADVSIQTVTHSFIAAQESAPRDFFASPLSRRLLVCKLRSGSEAELQYSTYTCGYLMALTLEFSNLAKGTKAAVRYDSEKQVFSGMMHSIALFTLVSQSVRLVACGQEHCMAITTFGQVYTWGNGNSGCLGHGDRTARLSPTLVEGLIAVNSVSGDCGAYHCAVVTSEGELWTWGRGDAHQLGISTDKLVKDEVGWISSQPKLVTYFIRRGLQVAQIACGEAHMLALDLNGAVHSCGWCEEGQVGRPSPASPAVSCKLGKVSLPASDPIVKVVAGSLHSSCLTQSGRLYIWGNGQQGQLGLGNSLLQGKFPMLLSSLEDVQVVDVIAGENSMLCLTSDYQVYGWGKGLAGHFESLEANVESQFPKGSELICFLPRLVSDVQTVHRFLASTYTEKSGTRSTTTCKEETITRPYD